MSDNLLSAEMAKLQELDKSLIQLIFEDQDESEEAFISVLLTWISGKYPPRDELLGQNQAGGYIEKLSKTTPSAFTAEFLDFVRTDSERIVAECELGNEGKEQPIRSPPTSLRSSAHASRGELLTSRSFDKKTPPANVGNFYDSEFPVLGVSNSNAPKQPHPKPRRVKPTPMESPVASSAFVFAKVESNKQSNSSSSRSQSMAPLKFDMDVLMKRCEKSKPKPKLSEVKIIKQSCSASTCEPSVLKDGGAAKGDMKSTHSSSVCKDKADAEGDIKSCSFIPSSILSKLKRFATVHAKLVHERLVPSLIGELHYLFQLLSFGQSTRQQGQVRIVNNELFGCGKDCSLYACTVMELLGRVLDSVGEPLLSAMINHPVIAQHAPALMMQIKQSLARHQASTLHSFKSYKASDPQTTDHGLPVLLPFQAERDSRNHFKTRESQKLYNNRELCRDNFYAIVREAASFQNSFGHTLDDPRLKIQESVKHLMINLMIENYPWFTELFLEHLVQVSVCGEMDPVVTGFARKDPIKLQKLHDRLILGSNHKLSRSSVFVSRGNNGSNAGDSKGAVTLLRSHSHTCSSLAGIELMAMFPQALRVYIWIMEAADSYRLGVQMIWSLKSKICKLTEITQHSRDSAEIGSVLTQRVLSLKALASLLGFLCFSPGVGSQSHGFEWERFRLDPPIDVVDVLEMAMKNETLLLTLPWILDYLQVIKADQHAMRLPYFQKALQTVRNVYNYSILDPKDDSFGAPSMCILSLLDSFFEWVDLLALDENVRHKVVESRKIHGCDGSTLDSKQCHGLDRLKGVVDTSYIQQCCPTLMELRLILINSEENPLNKNSGSKVNIAKVKSLRKITPIHNPKGFQISTQGSSFGPCEETLDVAGNHIQMKLQQSFFEQHQELQRLVDFVVDTTAVNAARAASSRSVPPVLEEALATLETMLTHKLQASMGNEEESQQERQVEAEVENMITACIQQALPLANEYAKKHTAERTSEALALLANPDECPFVLGIAGKIAADSASLAACKKTLANVSCEIRKKIMQELESWRRRFQNASKSSSREERLEQKAPRSTAPSVADVAPEVQDSFLEEKENMDIFCNIVQKGSALKQGITHHEVVKGETEYAQLPTCGQEVSFLLNRVLCCCAVVADCCEDPLKIDNQRHLLRVQLAVIATSLEVMLSSKCGEMPPGGFDSLVYPDSKSGGPSASLEAGNGTSASIIYPDEASAGAGFKIERGLARRCVALAFHLCLQSPCEAFGYDFKVMGQCRCFTALDFENKDTHAILPNMKDVCRELMKDEKGQVALGKLVEPCAAQDNEKLARKAPQCISNDHTGLMSGLLRVFVALEKSGVCEGNFFLFEFFSSWRWKQALLPEPWKASGVWFQAVKHGIANVLIRLVCGAQISPRDSKMIVKYFENFFTDFCWTKPEESQSLVILKEGKENLQKLKVVVIFIFLEIFELDSVHRRGSCLDLDQFPQGLAPCESTNLIKAIFRNMEVVG